MSQDPKRPAPSRLPPPPAPHRRPAQDTPEAEAGAEMLHRGVGLSPTGELEGSEASEDAPWPPLPPGRTAARPPAPAAGPRRLADLHDDTELELAERPVRPPADDRPYVAPRYAPPLVPPLPAEPPRRGWVGRLVLGLVLAAIVSVLAGAALLWRLGGGGAQGRAEPTLYDGATPSPAPTPGPTPRPAPTPTPRERREEYALTGTDDMRAAVLFVSSEPSGATVVIDGVAKGTTPLALDNHYARGRNVEVEVTLRGHRPWRGTFRGGVAATLDVELRRR